MNVRKLLAGFGTAALLLAGTVVGQEEPDRDRPDRDRPDRDRPGFGAQMNPLMMVLDTDRDGELSSEEIATASDALNKLDEDKDGKLTGEEISPPRLFLARIMGNDKNNDGKLSKEEIPERMAEFFPRLDTNSDGSIDREEMRAAARFRRPDGRDGEAGPGDRRRPLRDRADNDRRRDRDRDDDDDKDDAKDDDKEDDDKVDDDKVDNN